MGFLETIHTGSGFWAPIFWIIAFIVAILISYVIRGFGRKDYKRGTEQVKPFLAGNIEERKEALHIRGNHAYWGFKEALRGFYEKSKKFHSGDTRDYILWFIIILVISFVLAEVV